MKELSSQDRQVVTSQLQDKIDSLPATAKNPDICKFFDMLARSEELNMKRDFLEKEIEQDREPFLMLFHTGSVEKDPDHYVAFQLEAYKRRWIIRTGVLDPTGRDFLIAQNTVDVYYHEYEDFSAKLVVDEVFAAIQALLSGNLAVLESRASDHIYASELVLRSSGQAIATAWFGDKKIAEPREAVLQANDMVKDDAKAPSIFTAIRNDQPLFKGRPISEGKYEPLTLEEYQTYNGKLVTRVASKLSALSVGFMSLFVVSLLARGLDGAIEIYALIAVGAIFLILLGLLIHWFPQIAKMFFISWIVPLVVGAAVFMAFFGVGAAAYSLFPGLAEIVDDGENTALSMTIVLGWFTIALVTAGFAFFKSSKLLSNRYLRRLESRR